MKPHTKKHLLYYGALSLILVMGTLFIGLTSNTQQQITMVTMMTFFYIVIGLLHHHIHHDLSIKIVIEYILFGALGITVIFFLIH